MTYPKSIDINEAQVQKLTALFKQSYADISQEILTATKFGAANRRAILAQVDAILRKLGVDVDRFLRTELPDYYKSGAEDAIRQLERMNADVKVAFGFNRIHQDAINALISDTALSFADSMAGVKRSAYLLLNRAVREQIMQKIAIGKIAGKSLAEVRQMVKGIMQEQGLSALIDKGGRRWELDTYAEMLIRTKVVEARNRGMANRMAENGYDLVQVSSHANSCEMCAPWQGKILSLTGQSDEYPSVAEAESDGLFHPNCRHAINTLVPSLAKETEAYDWQTQAYS